MPDVDLWVAVLWGDVDGFFGIPCPAWLQDNSGCNVHFWTMNSHRLNGSSSPVLTATSLFYGETKNSTPRRIKTPYWIEIKFSTVDYVGEGTRLAKFYANPSKRGFSANGWNIHKKFLFICVFFSSTHPQVRPLKGFLHLVHRTSRFCTRKCLLGVRKLKYNI